MERGAGRMGGRGDGVTDREGERWRTEGRRGSEGEDGGGGRRGEGVEGGGGGHDRSE